MCQKKKRNITNKLIIQGFWHYYFAQILSSNVIIQFSTRLFGCDRRKTQRLLAAKLNT